MKTTIELPDELILRAKQEALERGTSLKEVIESALLQVLGRTRLRQPPLRTVVWPPSNIQAPPVSGSDILQMIRLERDRSTQFQATGKSGEAAPRPKVPVAAKPGSRKAGKRRSK